MRPLGLAAAGLLLAGPALAQGDCYPGPESNEARTLAIFSVPLAFSPMRAPDLPVPGQVAIGLEVSSIPPVDSATATPTICRPGKGPENTDLLPVLVRPRAVVGLAGGFFLEGSWIPPVRIAGVKANLFGIAIAKVFAVRETVTLALRAHGTFGQVNAPVTCPEEALADPTSECFEGTESDDRYHPNIFGVDFSAGFDLAEGRVRPYLGGGYSRLEPRFQVNFTNSDGETDNRRVIVGLNRLALFGGVTWMPGRLELNGEVYSTPADAVSGRLMVQYPW